MDFQEMRGLLKQCFKDAPRSAIAKGMRLVHEIAGEEEEMELGTFVDAYEAASKTIKAEMARNGVQPDTWIVPPGMKSFAALEEASVEYYRAGPIASANIAMSSLVHPARTISPVPAKAAPASFSRLACIVSPSSQFTCDNKAL